MKKFLFLAAACFLLLTGCHIDTQIGSRHVEDPVKYGEFESYLDIPPFLPDKIEENEVNRYIYTLESNMDVCYEIFLNLTVTQERFDTLLAEAKTYGGQEQQAAYAKDYTELVFHDSYETYRNDPTLVGSAKIEKVVYNPTTRNIVYVCFHADDTGVFAVKDVAYFNQFGIEP